MSIYAPTSASIQAWSARTLGVYSIKEAGAAVDGSTDDTAAIQRAVTAACARPGGKVVLGPGYSVISSAINVTDGCIIEGCGTGYYGSVINAKSGSETINMINVSTGGHDGVSIKGVRLGSANQKTAGAAILMDATTNFLIRDVLTTTQFDAIKCPFTSGSGGWIEDCHLYSSSNAALNIGTAGLPLDLFCRDLRLDNANLAKQGTGILVTSASGIYFDTADVINFSTGISVNTTTPRQAEYVYFDAILADSCNTGWDFLQTTGRLRTMHATKCYSANDSSNAVRIGAGTENIQWLGGVINRATSSGFLINGGARHQIHDVYFEAGNSHGTSYAPFTVGGAVTDLSVQGCMAETAGAVALGSSLTTNMMLHGNRFPGGKTGTAGTGSIGKGNIGITDF